MIDLSEILGCPDEKLTPLIIISQDEQLSFLDKRRLDMLTDLKEKKEKLLKELEEQIQEERIRAWKAIEDYCYERFGIPPESNLKITDGVLFLREGKHE